MINWDRIEAFIGYGRLDAPVVFIGMEEGLQQHVPMETDLMLRSRFEPVMDLREAHQGIAGTDKFFSATPVCQRTWRPMCDLMLRREGVCDPEVATRNRYQATRLGRSHGDTLIAEMLPYPMKNRRDISSWPYSKFGRFETNQAYLATIRPQRIELLRAALRCASREVIICHGKGEWPQFQAIFGDVHWKLEPPFSIASWKGVRVILTPQLSHRVFNSDDQLAQFAGFALR